MKWVLLIGLALSVLCFGLAYLSSQSAQSADERIGAIIPLMLGVGILIVDLVAALIYAVVK